MSFTLIRVGTKDHPATPDDIADMKALIQAAQKDNGLSLVTHHAVSFETVSTPYDQITVYTVGDDECPATPEDIKALQDELAAAAAEKRPVITHHRVAVAYLKL